MQIKNISTRPFKVPGGGRIAPGGEGELSDPVAAQMVAAGLAEAVKPKTPVRKVVKRKVAKNKPSRYAPQRKGSLAEALK